MNPAETTINGVRIVVRALSRDHEGRTPYAYTLIGAGLDYSGRDLHSGCQGGTAAQGLESLLSFLEACGEGVEFERRTGRHSDNADQFTHAVQVWCADNLEALGYARFCMEEPEA